MGAGMFFFLFVLLFLVVAPDAPVRVLRFRFRARVLIAPAPPHSRQALKKYILANHKNLTTTPAQFDQQFNKALRTGVDKGDFHQPKGTCSSRAHGGSSTLSCEVSPGRCSGTVAIGRSSSG